MTPGAARAVALHAALPGTLPVQAALAAGGLAAAFVAARAGFTRRAAILWLVAGVALGAASGLVSRSAQLRTAAAIASRPDAVVRFRGRIESGWTASRWGFRTRVHLENVTLGDRPIDLPRHIGLEVRGASPESRLPAPGSTCSGLASPRGDPARPFLAVASPRLLRQLAPPRGLDAFRNRGANALLAAAGTAPRRIRAAELAAALVFGRRDLMPRSRQDRWRSSGLAHVLAVSGLHVGLLGGMVWLMAVALGASPNTGRALVLLTVPAYAFLAGASPSAVRAAVMVVVYVAARMLGRPLVPMAAVLLAAVAMLLVDPSLIVLASFQLTVGITAALIRWVPSVSELLPLPRWLGSAIAVPVVAQLAAAPIVAWHFRVLIPGAVIANLLVPLLLGPILLSAFAAAALAPIAAAAAGPVLSVLGSLSRAALACGAPARAHTDMVPALPIVLTVTLIVLAVLALRPGRRARAAAVAWVLLVLLLPATWRLLPSTAVRGPSLLPVRDGLAALLPGSDGLLLVDGGRLPDEAARLLADMGVRRLGAVVASHTDEDHCGGLPTVLRTLRPRLLLFPAWMTTDPAVVPLLRTARRNGTSIVLLAQGVRTVAAGDPLWALWPPILDLPTRENDRSLVARVSVPGGTVLLTSDVSSHVERRLLRNGSFLRAGVLIAGHHGSASSSSLSFLRAVGPSCVLIPAGPWNVHHHPSRAVLRRLRAERLPWRAPIFSGPCGAERNGRGWRCWP